MNKEIKEILDEMLWQFEKYPNDDFIIKNKESRILLDYITNLQMEIDQSQEIMAELIEENEYLKLSNPEMNIEHFRVINENKRKIDNLRKQNKELQQENERLKEENKHIFANVNDDELLISNAMNYAEAQDYKSRCEKASEFVKSMEYCGQEDYFYDNMAKDTCGNDNTFDDSKEKLLNILQNGSEEK